MKREVVVSFVLVVLFFVSVFPLSTYSGAADSHGSSPRLLGSQSNPGPVDEWPMFHHDLTHTGYSTSTAPTTNQTLWSYTTGNNVASSPAVVGGIVYVGSDDYKVYALNATTGAFVWSYTTGNEVYYSSPAVVGGIVYVGSWDDEVYAFGTPLSASISPGSSTLDVGQSQLFTSAVSGGASPYTYQWYLNGAPVSGATNPNWTFTPASAGSYKIYMNVTDAAGTHVASNTATAEVVKEWPMFHHDPSHTGYLTSIGPTTNNTLWTYTTGAGKWGAKGVEYSSLAVVGGLVYVGSDDENVYCLNAATGALVWSYKTGDSVTSSPAVVGGLVYVGSMDGNVYCLNATTGALVWSYTTGNRVWSSPAVVGGLVYVGSMEVFPSDYGKVYCLNATTGAFVWSYTTGAPALVFSSPAVVGGLVYVGSDDFNVYCLNATTGTQVWSYTTGNYVESSPAVVGGLVYVGSYDDNVYCLNAGTGALVWSYTTGNYVDSSPAVVDGVAYVGSVDGKIYAFGFPSVTDSTTVLGGNFTVDETAVTGVSLNVTGSTAPDGTNVNVSSTNFGNTMPPSVTGVMQIAGALYYDVQVNSTVPLGPYATATVAVTNVNFKANSVMSYWNGTDWIAVPTLFIPPDTLCGTFFVSDLTGTPIMISSPPPSGGGGGRMPYLD